MGCARMSRAPTTRAGHAGWDRPGDPGAVVDTDCRVIGLDGLRVVDASIFPTVPYGNINAPTIMVAEKAADIILGQPALPPSTAPSWISDTWETRQRENMPNRQIPD